jgi:anti-anti-sigma regulatory factor
VDMTRTRYCDSAGVSALVAAHKWALAEGGGLRLVIPDGSRVLRIFTVIGLGRFIPRFGSLDRTLPPGPVAAG